MTRSARSAWSFLSSVVFSAVSMVVAFGVTPILLRELGAARLGAARAVMDWAAYLTLFELGLNGALLPLLGRAVVRGDPAEVKATLSAGFRAYVLVTVPMLAGAVLLTLAVTHLVKVDPALHHDLRLAAVMAALPLLLMPLSPLRALVEANQRGYVLSAFFITQSLIVAGSGLLLAKLGWGITGQTFAIALGALAFGSMLLIESRRNAVGMLPLSLQTNDESWRALWTLNTPTLILNVCGRVGLLTDNIVIGSILSAPMIVPFLMTQRLGQIATSQLQAVGTTSWAGLVQLYSNGEHETFRARFLELNQLVMTLGLMVLVPILAYNHAFVSLWVGETSYGGMALTSLAACNGLVLAVTSLWGWLFGGTGQMARVVRLSIASVSVNLLVSIGFTWAIAKSDPHRAMLGPVVGTTAAMILVNLPLTPFLLRRHFGIPLRGLIVALGKPLAIGLPFGVGLVWLANAMPPRCWLMLGADMAGGALLFALICWLMLLNVEDRRRWLLRVQLATGGARG